MPQCERIPALEAHKATLYYEVHGRGPPLVLAHGAGTNLLIWYNQVPYFARRHRTVVYDQRGFGRSTCERSDLKVVHLADDLRAICDAAGVERAVIVGHSLGAIAGLRFALEYPERVSSLVLCSSAGGIITEKLLRFASQTLQQYMRTGPVPGHLFPPGYVEREPVKVFLQEQIVGLNQPLDPALMASAVEARLLPEELTGFAVPTLVVVGELDPLFSSEGIQDAAQWIPGAKVVEFPGCGHLPFFEEPERFNRLVGDFARRHPSD